MSLDKAILEVVENKLKDGFFDKLIEEKFVEGIEKALSSTFSSYGDVTKVVEKKVKEVIIPFLENYDYSEYVTKLDHVMVEILQQTATPHKTMLENFKSLAAFNPPKRIKVTDIFEEWKKHVAHNVDTSDLEVCFDEEPSYDGVVVTLTIEEDSNYRSWVKREEKTILLECEQDEKMNHAIKLYRYTDISEKWEIEYRERHDIRSLRYLNEFEVFLMQLGQAGTEIELDEDAIEDEVEPEAQPEPEWN